jgi:Pyoverdine/dityrosine biosynthesis protein
MQTASAGLSERLSAYLQALVAELDAPWPRATAMPALDDVAARTFATLTAREFCYLSQSRVAPYRDQVLRQLAAAALCGVPLRFYFDIGGGYHASLRPGTDALSFDVGLAELLVLRQIRRFAARITEFYPPGVQFWLVIDNLCALLVNDIPLARTTAYCRQLRELIAAAGMEQLVSVLVESESFDTAEFEAARPADSVATMAAATSTKDHQNIERFLGRSCDENEAAERMARYRRISAQSEALLDSVIDGVHMTQRASPTTLCFRPYPGGDSRIQTGEVSLRGVPGGGFQPLLLTSRNLAEYACQRYRCAELSPKLIAHVTYAEPLAFQP